MHIKSLFKLALFIQLIVIRANVYSQDFILNTLNKELTFQEEKYKTQKEKPYYIQFKVTDISTVNITSSFGSIITSSTNNGRIFSSEFRLGGYQFDNTHTNESNRFSGVFGTGSFPQILPQEDSVDVISTLIRKNSEKAYKGAQEQYKQKINNKSEGKTPNKFDFSIEEPSVYYEEKLPETYVNIKEWEERLKELSAYFAKDKFIESSNSDLQFNVTRTYLVNTEKSSTVQNFVRTQLNISLLVKCSDNNIAPVNKSFYAFTPGEIPSNEEIKKVLADLKNIAIKLKDAPSADAYSGPCVLSSSAAGVLFHEIFGHRVEGHRLNLEMDAQTLKDKVGDNILPEFISINFNPTVQKFNDVDLFGYYQYDDQAVKSQKVQVVNKGKLSQFLMCRTPIDSVTKSNGHGRSAFGMPVVSRQSNMFVESSKTVKESQLREQLIKLCKKKKLPYGLYFKEVTGGFTKTSRGEPNVFNITPIEVYKVYTDGRPDELIKGVSLIGTPLTLFTEIIMAGDNQSVFNGYCYAESGPVPVSTISPALLLNKIETQKTFEIKNSNKQLSRPDLLK